MINVYSMSIKFRCHLTIIYFLCLRNLAECLSLHKLWKINYLLMFLLLPSSLAHMVKILPAVQETQVQSLGQEDPLEKERAIPLKCFC